MKTSVFSSALVGCLALVVLNLGCTEQRFDCRDMCATVQSCVAVDIDVSGCTDNCTAFSNISNSTENRAEACNDCLDVNGCASPSPCAAVCGFMNVPLD